MEALQCEWAGTLLLVDNFRCKCSSYRKSGAESTEPDDSGRSVCCANEQEVKNSEFIDYDLFGPQNVTFFVVALKARTIF